MGLQSEYTKANFLLLVQLEFNSTAHRERKFKMVDDERKKLRVSVNNLPL